MNGIIGLAILWIFIFATMFDDVILELETKNKNSASWEIFILCHRFQKYLVLLPVFIEYWVLLKWHFLVYVCARRDKEGAYENLF